MDRMACYGMLAAWFAAVQAALAGEAVLNRNDGGFRKIGANTLAYGAGGATVTEGSAIAVAGGAEAFVASVQVARMPGYAVQLEAAGAVVRARVERGGLEFILR